MAITSIDARRVRSICQLISAPFKFWTLGAEATDTLLDWGQRHDLVLQARAAYEGSIANYRQTVLSDGGVEVFAIRRAGITAGDIDYINAHGTSTPLGDEIELKAVERLVGNAGGRIAMSSTKSSIGHLLGAAGAVEAIFCLLAMRDEVVPPTINLDNPSVATAIDLVPHKARKRPINVALSNSFGFGGTNASLVFRRLAQ